MLSFRHTRRSLTARALLAFVVAGTVAFGAPSGAEAAGKKVKCDASAGWAALAGRSPSFVVGGPTGLYLWQERGVWRLGATNDRAVQTTFTATVSFDAAIARRPVGTEGKSDIVDVRSQSVRIRFSNFGGLDGVAIESPCASSITVQGAVDGQPLTPQQVFLGGGAVNPSAVPVTLTRSTLPASASAPTVAPSNGVAGGASTGASTATSAAAAVTAACSTPAWPAALVGRPAIRRNLTGVFAWIEKGGALRVAFESDPGTPHLIEGRVVANGPVIVRFVPNSRRDVVKASGQQVTFSLRARGSGDTFDVVAPCANSFSIDATIDGVQVTPAQVFLGPSATPAVSLPTLITRP